MAWRWRLGGAAVVLALLAGVWTAGHRHGTRGVRLEWAKAEAVERTDDARARAAWADERDWLTRQAAARAVAVVRADQGTVAEEAKQVETIKTVYRTIRGRAESLPLRVDCALGADPVRDRPRRCRRPQTDRCARCSSTMPMWPSGTTSAPPGCGR